MTYYTLSRASLDNLSHFKLSKWDPSEDVPEATYQVQVRPSFMEGVPFGVEYCGCPSRSSPCKHAVIVEAILATVGPNDLHRVYWQNEQVLPTKDII